MRSPASSRPLVPVLLFLLAALPAPAQEPYKLPPKEVVELVDAPPPPQAVVSPTGDAVLLAEPEAYPPIALLAEPVLRPDVQASAEEIVGFCRLHLAAFKVPRQVAFRAELPKSMVGKYLRRVLVEQERAPEAPAP